MAEATSLLERARCARCGDEVSPDQRAPCPECGALLHARCYVEGGGCTTIGCSNAAEGLARRPQSAIAVRDAARLRAQRAHSAVSLAAVGSGSAGAAGMALSFLAMSAGAQGVVAGAFGFFAGALLVTTGVLALAIAALRPPRDADGGRVSGGALAVVAGVIAGLTLVAGVGGMGLSFLVLAVGAMSEMLPAGAAFASGAALVLGGGVSSALLALGRDPPE